MTPKNPETAKQCSCVIRHARTEKERATVEASLFFYQANGDKVGERLANAVLGACEADR